ncbi:MAG: menaquinone biosynthesis protein [Pyrinomonadaceae bacterium]
MSTPRISASSYSNTAPLVWSFLYGRNHGSVEIILDNAPARSAALLSEDRVDAALVPVIAYQMIEGLRLVPDVCVGARERVRSVCLVTGGMDLADVRSVSLDVSSKTSVVLTKIIFREFIGFEPEWRSAEPNVVDMLAVSDAALLIGDPALALSSPPYKGGVDDMAPLPPEEGWHRPPVTGWREGGRRGSNDEPPTPRSALRTFDLADLWHHYTGLGFVFAMWMTRHQTMDIDFAAARDEGLEHLSEIIANYESDIHLGPDQMRSYLSENISYSIDESMRKGMELYFRLASTNRLTASNRLLTFVEP